MNELGLWLAAYVGTAWLHGVMAFAAVWMAIRARVLVAPSSREAAWRVVVIAPLLTAALQLAIGEASLAPRFALSTSPADASIAPEPVSSAPANARDDGGVSRRGSVRVYDLMPLRGDRHEARVEDVVARDLPRATVVPLVDETTHEIPVARLQDASLRGDVARPSTLSSREAVGAASRFNRGEDLLRLAIMIGGWLWIALAAGISARVLGRWVMARRRARELPRIDDAATRDMAARLARRLRLRMPALLRDDALDGPVALAPDRVCVPGWMLARLAPAQREAMLAHELAHLARGDVWWRVALTLAANVVPARGTHYACRELDALAEHACDAFAARQGSDPRALAECLALCAERGAPRKGPDFAVAMASAPSSLIERVQRLIEDRPMRFEKLGRARGLLLAASVLGAAVLLPGMAPRVLADAGDAGVVSAAIAGAQVSPAPEASTSSDAMSADAYAPTPEASASSEPVVAEAYAPTPMPTASSEAYAEASAPTPRPMIAPRAEASTSRPTADATASAPRANAAPTPRPTAIAPIAPVAPIGHAIPAIAPTPVADAAAPSARGVTAPRAVLARSASASRGADMQDPPSPPEQPAQPEQPAPPPPADEMAPANAPPPPSRPTPPGVPARHRDGVPTPPPPPAKAPEAPPSPPAPPSQPAPQAPPSPPEPPTPPKGKHGSDNVATSISITDWIFGKHLSVQHRRPGLMLNVEADGDFSFNTQENDVATLSDEMTIEEQRDGVTRQIHFTFTDGRIAREFSVDGETRPFDDQARQWLAQVVPAVMRESGYDAEARVDRILARGGANAVIDEIGLIGAESVRANYLGLLFGKQTLDAAQLDRAVALASEIDSNYALREALTEAYDHQTLPPATQMATLKIAARFDSDYERRELLTTIVEHMADDEQLRAAWFDAADQVESSYEHRVAITEFLDHARASEASVIRAIASARGIESNYERREALSAIAPAVARSERAAIDYANAVAEISSSYEARVALSELVENADLSPAAAMAVLRASRVITSDYERREAMVALAERMPNDAGLINEYRASARELGNYERGEAERALDRFAQ